MKNTIGKSFIFQRRVFSIEQSISEKSRCVFYLCKPSESLRLVSAYQYEAELEAKNTGTTTIRNHYQTLLLRCYSGTGGNEHWLKFVWLFMTKNM